MRTAFVGGLCAACFILVAHDHLRAANAPQPLVAPFSADQATEAQQAWAESLGQPVTVENSIGMQLVLIPPGEFMMGAEEDRSDTLNYFPYCDPKWLDGELPRHKVRITRPFYLGAHEVRLKEFLTFYHAAKYKLDME